jgi:LysM repeat protein
VPQVDSYDEEMYQCQQGDSVASISMRYYQSEKYAQALLLFNRNHPRASDGVLLDPPVLQAGQPVFIPPLRILERNYARAIPDHTPLPPPASLAPPAGLSPPRFSSAPIATPAAGGGGPVASAGKTYRLPQNAMFYEIAKRTLGSGDRWWDIAQLNPRYNPKDPVPAGTVLQLPADARVEGGEMP